MAWLLRKKIVGKEYPLPIRLRDLPLALVQHNIPDINLKFWLEEGNGHVRDITTGPSLNSLEQISKKFNPSNKEFFKYLSIRNFLSYVDWATNPPNPTFKICFNNPSKMIKGLSTCYKTLLPTSQPHDLSFINKWEIYLAPTFSDQQ